MMSSEEVHFVRFEDPPCLISVVIKYITQLFGDDGFFGVFSIAVGRGGVIWNRYADTSTNRAEKFAPILLCEAVELIWVRGLRGLSLANPCGRVWDEYIRIVGYVDV